LLDFVPNHVAPDHPWLAEHPEYFVHGTEDDLAAHPDAWLRTPGGIVAHGRDPFFPPWRDVVQLDPMSEPLRDAAVATLVDIADQCDGVRCDMANLLLDEVAERTWAGRMQPARPEPYWREVTHRVRAQRPGFVFLAEAYWRLEGALTAQGLASSYEKPLYDRLVHADPQGVRAHVHADPALQGRLVRFLENHDEPRAAAAFPVDRLRAAAVALLTLPGVILLHDGQLEGRRVRVPVQLGRAPVAAADADASAFWTRLLAVVAREQVRSGDWQLLDVHGWPDNRSCESILAWRWRNHLVAINYSGSRADGLVQLGDEWSARRLMLHDVLHDVTYSLD